MDDLAEPITFAANRKSALAFTGIFLVLTAFSIWAGLLGLLWGWLSAAFWFVFAALWALPLFSRDSMYVRLDKQGVEISSILMRKTCIKWMEIEELKMGETSDRNELITIVYTSPQTGRRHARNLVDNYSETMAVILWTLNKWRERYGESG